MTYGWAIMVVLVVLIVAWQWGLFDIAGRVEPGSFGFWGVMPQDYVYHSSGEFEVNLLNAVGANVTLVGVNATSGGSDVECEYGGTSISTSPVEIERGHDKTITCSLDSYRQGNHFEAFMKIVYNDTRLSGHEFTSSGRIWGSVEV